MSSSTVEDEICLIGKVSDYPEVTDRTIHRLAADKHMLAFKIFGCGRFSRQDIDCWIQSHAAVIRVVKPGK